ncbi:M24 family metallopeptidase [Desulfosporosinus sp. PR]|uniref:M24 family metallopeptidase n=1 Tax=Candidatus Desulfosporosinus nitrosoreducens TaxID=3401928 RepID=UPI0027E62BE9|nr:M24 family metallopeptidase [Desulfosporosinus sp. PR]MDQ7093600.1 M24 family metallopeptidase [Desulfosporosinus sp. PR]
MQENKTFKERIRFPIPTRELERRWKLVRAAMKKQGIDLLLMHNDNQFLGGYVRYFIDIPAEHAYAVSVLFPVDDEMTTIFHAAAANPSPPAWSVRGIKTRLSAPYLPTLHYTNTFEAQEMVKVIKDRKDKKVGLVGLGLISTVMYKYLQDNLPGVELVDASDLVDEIKAVKSEDELTFIRESARIHDAFASAMPSIIRPGAYEYEIRTEIVRLLENLGSEEQLVMMGSAPHGTPTPHLDTFFHNRQIQKGDQVMVMVEANGPGGYYSELVRTWCLGEPSPELLALWEMSKKIQHYGAGLLKPGAKPAEIISKVNNVMAENGFPAEGRLFGHGQGYDLVERPALVPLETLELKANMVLALHPILANEKAFTFCCDDYLITENGAERLQKSPQEIVIL